MFLKAEIYIYKIVCVGRFVCVCVPIYRLYFFGFFKIRLFLRATLREFFRLFRFSEIEKNQINKIQRVERYGS